MQDKHGTAVRKDTILPGPLQGAATLPIKLTADVLRWTGYQRKRKRRRRVWGRERETAYSPLFLSPMTERCKAELESRSDDHWRERRAKSPAHYITLIVCHPVPHILLYIIHVNYKHTSKY